MKTIEEIKNWLLKNAVNDEGNLDLSNLDFSNFDGNVFINYMRVKRSLFQNRQEVGGDLLQNEQIVAEDLHQDYQTVGENFYNHKLDKGEYWDESKDFVIRRKKLKEIGYDDAIETRKGQGYILHE